MRAQLQLSENFKWRSKNLTESLGGLIKFLSSRSLLPAILFELGRHLSSFMHLQLGTGVTPLQCKLWHQLRNY